jgi:ubiquitin-conjugating enzyme E2 D/E
MGIFHFYLEFPMEYPFRPPKVRFITPIFHPNINDDGMIFITLFQDSWSPIDTMSSGKQTEQ